MGHLVLRAVRRLLVAIPLVACLLLVGATEGMKVYVDAQVAAVSSSGAIQAYAGSSAPTGWLLCDGSAVSRTTYAALFAVTSTTYGTGDGSTTFNVPDLRQRFPIGLAASGTGSTLGGTGGAIDHAHGSPITSGGPSATQSTSLISGTGPTGTHTHTVTLATANPPFLAVTYVIKQ